MVMSQFGPRCDYAFTEVQVCARRIGLSCRPSRYEGVGAPDNNNNNNNREKTHLAYLTATHSHP